MAARSDAAHGDVWLFYPFATPAERQWMVLAWLILGAIGLVVQLGVTAKGTK